ncbi:unnamed protein product [Boreogadus saida]
MVSRGYPAPSSKVVHLPTCSMRLMYEQSLHDVLTHGGQVGNRMQYLAEGTNTEPWEKAQALCRPGCLRQQTGLPAATARPNEEEEEEEEEKPLNGPSMHNPFERMMASIG